MVVKHIVKMERKERKKNGEKEGSNKKEGREGVKKERTMDKIEWRAEKRKKD